MSIRKDEFQKKNAELKDSIKNILNRIKKNEDPDEMNMYRKILRRHVPFFMRNYFAAYFMKEFLEKNNSTGSFTRNRNEEKTLFISVGKNRHVFPKDLISLLSGTAHIDKESIGDIKILDNYSFVNINPEQARIAIDQLDGIDYRGRKITVNYSRKGN